VGLSRSVLHYASQRRDDGLKQRLVELAGERRRFGYRRLHILVEREGFVVNHKRVHRCIGKRGWPCASAASASGWRSSRPLLVPSGPNHTWSMDFVFDALANGRPIKCLTVVDDCTKEAVEIAVGRRINGQGVADILEAECRFRGYPAAISAKPGSGVHRPGAGLVGDGQRRAAAADPAGQAGAERLQREHQRQVPRPVPQRALVRDPRARQGGDHGGMDGATTTRSGRTAP
jgi:transposase InsO family protein